MGATSFDAVLSSGGPTSPPTSPAPADHATTRLETDLACLGIGELVDHVVSSARVGFAKPDPRLYRVAAEWAGAPARRCLFVDDSAGNVAAARALGMAGVRFECAGQLRGALAPLLT